MMALPDFAVVNTSPLIHLSEAGLLNILRSSARTILVPEPVAREIRAYGPHDPTARALASHGWLNVQPVDVIDSDILAWDLGAGESSVLTLARRRVNSVAVIDDLAGRRCAEALGLPLKGTIGLVLAEKKAGRLERARPTLETLREAGMYVSDAALGRALALVGE